MSYTPKIKFYEQRSLGDRLNVTFEFIRENFKSLFKTLLIIDGPIVVIVGFAYAYNLQTMQQAVGDPTMASDPLNMMYSSLVLMIAAFFLMYSFFAIVLRYMKLYQEMPPEEITTGLIVKSLFKDGGRMFLVSIPSWILLMLATVAFIFPGVYCFVALSMVFTILVFEDGPIFGSISRSFKMVQDNWWNTFGQLIVLYFIQIAISLMFYIPFYAFMASRVLTNTQDPSAIFGDGSSTTMLIMAGCMAFAYLGILMSYSISIIAISFQYFNLREQKEAVGLMSNIDNMEATV